MIRLRYRAEIRCNYVGGDAPCDSTDAIEADPSFTTPDSFRLAAARVFAARGWVVLPGEAGRCYCPRHNAPAETPA